MQFWILAAASPDGSPIPSPWRVLILSKDLHDLVNSDLVPALCDPPDPRIFPEGVRTGWIKPGKAPWTGMVYGNDGAQWDRQKWWVDLCAAIGCECLLVDAGWRTERWGWVKNGGNVWARAAELCRYAAERNVGIFRGHAYLDGRDDSPGLTSVDAREELFRNCQKAWVKGVKIDFFDSESRAVIDACEDLLQRSAKYHLVINFHGANKPTGKSRTWPSSTATRRRLYRARERLEVVRRLEVTAGVLYHERHGITRKPRARLAITLFRAVPCLSVVSRNHQCLHMRSGEVWNLSSEGTNLPLACRQSMIPAAVRFWAEQV